MTPKLIAPLVRQQYDRLARQIIAGTLREMVAELNGKYANTLAAFAKGLSGTPYPGARRADIPTKRDAASAERLRTAKTCLGDVADALRQLASDIQPPDARHVA